MFARRHAAQRDCVDPRGSPHSPAFCGSWLLPPDRLFLDVFTSLRLSSPAVTRATCRKKKAKNNNFIPPATPDTLGEKWGERSWMQQLQWLESASCS